MDNILTLIGKTIAYLGGASVIILAISNWIGKIWANIFIKNQEVKYQKDIECYKNQLSEQLEILKAKNEKVNYISKVQFDTEFNIYKELSETSFLMLLSVSQLFPAGLDQVPEDKQKQQELYETRYNKANKEYFDFQNKLFQVAPFISKEIYDLFNELMQEARLQVVFYPRFVLRENKNYSERLVDMETECWERTPVLTEKHKFIIESLRVYLTTLKVNEE